MQDLRRCALSGLRLLTVMLLCALSCACCHKFGACGSIPVDEVPCELLAQPREALLPINFSMLGQPQPPEHLIDTGDTLGVYVKGVLDLQESPRPVEFPTNTIDLNIKTPSVGFPLKVGPEGEVDLPLLGDVAVRGLSLDEATDTIRKEYVAREIVSKNADQTVVWLIKPRTTRVVVIREDSPVTSPVLNGETDYTILSKRGTSQLVELPAYENDVLHALSASGGLPGTDAENEVIIFRSIHGAPAIGANGEPLSTKKNRGNSKSGTSRSRTS